MQRNTTERKARENLEHTEKEAKWKGNRMWKRCYRKGGKVMKAGVRKTEERREGSINRKQRIPRSSLVGCAELGCKNIRRACSIFSSLLYSTVAHQIQHTRQAHKTTGHLYPGAFPCIWFPKSGMRMPISKIWRCHMFIMACTLLLGGVQ